MKALSHFLFMDNNKKSNVPWWREGVIVFIKVSGYIAFPVIIASFLGKYLDQKYNTGNSLFLVCVGIAFISTIFLLLRELRIYIKNINKENKK